MTLTGPRLRDLGSRGGIGRGSEDHQWQEYEGSGLS